MLPAHEYRFVGLDARLAELRAHHEQRFAEVIDAVRDGVDTRRGTSPPGWTGRDRGTASTGFMRRAAVGEAMAHLRALERRGILHEIAGEPSTWELRADWSPRRGRPHGSAELS